MKGWVRVRKTIILVFVLFIISSMMAGCARFDFSRTGEYIVTAKEALSMIKEGAILVDVESASDYNTSHIKGAINIPMTSLTTNEPYQTMLAEASVIEQIMSKAGVSHNDMILLYDNSSNMKAARVQWTLNMYGNFNVRVISGGFDALKKAKAETTSAATVLQEKTYIAGERDRTLVVNLDYIKSIVNMPSDKTIILDTRSFAEYAEGTIPGAINIEYVWNNYKNGEYKTIQDIQNTYLEKGITPDMRIIVFCKVSVRAAQTYTALKNAGYQDVRIYDAAWLEYSEKEIPFIPVSDKIKPTTQDAS